MKFAARVRDLGTVDSAPLERAVLAQCDEAWREFDHRQRAYEVHHDTQSIVLLFCDDRWPDVTVTRQPGWGRLAEAAEPLMGDIISRHYQTGGVVLRAMAARLVAGGRIVPHIDAMPSFVNAHRIHVPLTTNPGVRFTVDGRPCPMEPGHAYEINNQLPHSVMNVGGEDRISFIFDYLPPAP